jgi:hypothetical protein
LKEDRRKDHSPLKRFDFPGVDGFL